MTDEQREFENANEAASDVSRRDFIAMSVAAGSVAAGIVAAGVETASAAMAVTESDVMITTPDGMCDAAFIHPTTGSHPGVLIWTDAFGLRPSMRGIGRRIAAEGYSVLVPNPFYRVAKSPVFTDTSTFSFQNPADMAKLGPLMGSINAPGAAEKDAVAFIGFLDAQKEVNKSKKIGTQGYCMGGPLVVKTCAVLPDRVGAGGSFHGGGLVTDKPDSPHLLAPKNQGAHVFRNRIERRHAPARRQRQAEGRFRQRSRGDRGVWLQARMVRAGYAGRRRRTDLQHDRRRKGVGQAGRAVQSRPGLVSNVLAAEIMAPLV